MAGVGWAVDDASAWYECTSTVLLLIALILVPISQNRIVNRTVSSKDDPESDGVTINIKRNARITQLWFWGVAFVSLFFLAWETTLSITWGYGWSKSLLAPEELLAANVSWTTAEYGDATHASGRQGVRDAEPSGRFGISTTLDPPVRSDSRAFRRLRP